MACSLFVPRDVDLLGFGDLSDDSLLDLFKEIASTGVEPDGVVFDATTITVARIREEDPYGGRRVMLSGHLGSARLRVQVDIGSATRSSPILSGSSTRPYSICRGQS